MAQSVTISDCGTQCDFRSIKLTKIGLVEEKKLNREQRFHMNVIKMIQDEEGCEQRSGYNIESILGTNDNKSLEFVENVKRDIKETIGYRHFSEMRSKVQDTKLTIITSRTIISANEDRKTLELSSNSRVEKKEENDIQSKVASIILSRPFERSVDRISIANKESSNCVGSYYMLADTLVSKLSPSCSSSFHGAQISVYKAGKKTIWVERDIDDDDDDDDDDIDIDIDIDIGIGIGIGIDSNSNDAGSVDICSEHSQDLDRLQSPGNSMGRKNTTKLRWRRERENDREVLVTLKTMSPDSDEALMKGSRPNTMKASNKFYEEPVYPANKYLVGGSYLETFNSFVFMLVALLVLALTSITPNSMMKTRRMRPMTISSWTSTSIAIKLISMVLIVILVAQNSSVANSLDCFICQSRNGSNPACEDPFHNLHSTRITTPILPENRPNVSYQTPCFASRKGRDGVFPASACLKLSGTFDNGEKIVVRHCGLDSGTLTQDTEIVRVSHCGTFQLDGSYLKGCMMACTSDACNLAMPSVEPAAMFVITFSILLTLIVTFKSISF